MSTPNLATEQLLELLLTLKKTTPSAAKSILNGQPQIAYALIPLMVQINAINFEVFTKTLATRVPAAPAAVPPAAPTVASAIPPHIQQSQYRTTTPPNAPITSPASYAYTNGQGSTQQYPQQPPATNYGHQGYSYHQPPTGYPNYAAPPQSATATPALPDALEDEQKALIMRVISMTPAQLNTLPPAERAAYIQIRATLGIS